MAKCWLVSEPRILVCVCVEDGEGEGGWPVFLVKRGCCKFDVVFQVDVFKLTFVSALLLKSIVERLSIEQLINQC